MRLITGYGAPTDLTVGELGQRYLDLDTDKKYVCVDIQREEYVEDGVPETDIVHFEAKKILGNFYTWEELAGSGPDVIITGANADTDDGGTTTVWTLTKGDYETIVNKINAGEVVRGILCTSVQGTGDRAVMHALIFHVNTEASSVLLVFPDGMFNINSNNEVTVATQ